MPKTATKQTERDPLDLLIDGLFVAAEQHGWRGLALEQIAEAADLDLKIARRTATSAVDLLGHAIRRADRYALGEIAAFADDDTTRDRLFALLMARFDAMTPHRDGVKAILQGGRFDPALHLTIAAQGLCSMSRMLEAAGLSADGPAGLARAKGLALVNANAVRTWLDDDSEDLGKTMSVLDKGLARAESLALSFDPAARRAKSEKTAENSA